MRLIFAGTPRFAAVALGALQAAGHDITLVLTQPDRPAGRGLKLKASETAEVAASLGLRIEKPATLKDIAVQQMIKACDADVMVVAAYGLLLPQAVLDIPKQGCINIHGSLLPRWRGAAPVQRAIEAGDSQTGIAIMKMDIGLDTGPVLLETRLSIIGNDTSASLFEKLTVLGAESIVEALATLPLLKPQTQPTEGASYARKIEKSEAPINWSEPAAVIERRIRAFDPFPGCETKWGEITIKIWRASVVHAPAPVNHPPGTIIDLTRDQLTVQCGKDALSLGLVQKPGGKRITVAEFLHGVANNHTIANVTAIQIKQGSILT